MSARLRQLLAEIDAAVRERFGDLFERAACERWADAIRAELDEREAPPVALEPAIAEILQELDESIEIMKALHARWPDTRGAEVLATLRIRLRDLALRSTRPATHEEALGVALDFAEERGELFLGEEQLSVQPAVWEQDDEPEPVHPRQPGIWWPKGEAFRGYGLHLVDDHACEKCGEYVSAVDEDGLCEGCAETALGESP